MAKPKPPALGLPARLTPAELASLSAATNAEEWSAAVGVIWAARGGAEPRDWYSMVVCDGLGQF